MGDKTISAAIDKIRTKTMPQASGPDRADLVRFASIKPRVLDQLVSASSSPKSPYPVTYGADKMLAPFATCAEPTTPRTSRALTKQHRFRSLTGCLTCRQRKKKCDERKPKCIGCTRNGLQCAWPVAGTSSKPPKSVLRAASRDCKDSPDQLDPSARWSNLTGSFVSLTRASTLTGTSSLLFTHYITETANVLSSFSPDGNNPFVTLLVPLCCNDDLLMHSLLALSGAHMKFRNPGIETLSGDDQGAMFSHLRASRQLILRLADGPLSSSTNENGRLFAFVLEIYRFLILSNNIIPYGAINRRTVPHDTFLDGILGTMNHFDTWGVIFGDSHGLFELLPDIAVLAARRLTEQTASQASLEMQQALYARIIEWKPPESTATNQKCLPQRDTALNLCREAALLYLETAMAPDALNDTVTLARVQKHIDNIMLYAEQAAGSPYETIFLGPLIIVGSCMLQAEQRQLLLDSLRSNRFHMNHCLQAASLLEQLWNDRSGRLFGPYGLAIIMRRRGINLGIA
ncbi:fungal-specific transcription factor domain-containing protein [Penicillium cataractarum]|uniref:Fungal-specific transcription factor domain-containing protein n=1 Tax=Penicillium cataractarum TaxID=2100454 RepID=A0A9W9V0Y8_9EURO|nr:fungal-specific transcription factor domain-containing protein [Penicillium cataractarum]KAJ5364808.1 fungal-specific transcription factor domain-containing protein [Penicillium cataractarum]